MRRLLAAVGQRPRVLAFIDLVQDVDVLLPVLLGLRDDGALALKVTVSRWLATESPRTALLLERAGIPFSYVRRREVVEGRAPSLRGLAGVISAAESSHPAHAAAHALARRAASQGVRTYALQHGFENIGLFGLETSGAQFASEVVFCWFPPEAAPPALPEATRRKLAHVGRPWPAVEAAPHCEFALGVFENLHWERYSDADRLAFREGLAAAARALEGQRILLRPHPAGAWADQLGEGLARFGNITAVHGADARRDPAGGADVVRKVARVITTPSTVALDAAMAGRPVALAAEGGAPYAPLPVLRSPADWVDFALQARPDTAPAEAFRRGVLVEGDAVARITARLRTDLRRSLKTRSEQAHSAGRRPSSPGD